MGNLFGIIKSSLGEFINKTLGIQDKIQVIFCAILCLAVLIIGFILGAFFGNPTIKIYVEDKDGQKEVKVWEQPQVLQSSSPDVLGSYEEGAFCKMPDSLSTSEEE